MINLKLIAATLFALAIALLIGPGCSWAQTDEPSPLTSLQPPPGFDHPRIETLAEAINFATWPRPEARFVAPAIDRSLLERPEGVTHETLTYSTVRFQDGLWGQLEQSWRSAQKLPQPTDTPVESSPPERFQVKGDLLIEVTLAPSARAAQEYLLTDLANNMLPTEEVVSSLKAAERPAGLGDVAFLLKSRDGIDQRLRFVRNNVYVSVRADGDFAPDALATARAIDGRIVSQQPLSYEQLLARRPTVSLGSRTVEGLRYQVSPPLGQQVSDLLARVDGQQGVVERGQVYLPEQKGERNVEVIAITRDLLVGTAKQRITLP